MLFEPIEVEIGFRNSISFLAIRLTRLHWRHNATTLSCLPFVVVVLVLTLSSRLCRIEGELSFEYVLKTPHEDWFEFQVSFGIHSSVMCMRHWLFFLGAENTMALGLMKKRSHSDSISV
jgi:hypothetical protein